MAMLPIDKYTFRAVRVPAGDIRKIIKSLDLYIDDVDALNKIPSNMKVRSVFAWAILMTYRESPAIVVMGLVAVGFIIPLLIFVRLFS